MRSMTCARAACLTDRMRPGWNITAGGARPFHQGQICNYVGGMVPFARTRAERLASGHAALQRLHIAETPVTDLSPLKGMKLTRLVFTPANITAGIEVAKSLPLQEIGTRFDDGGKDLVPPASFWPAYDAAVKSGGK